jgi:hypothetical protein
MKFEVTLTEGNFGKERRNWHIYIDSFLDYLPKDIIGGSNSKSPALRMMTLEYNGGRCLTDIPTDKRTGKPRPFFRARAFIRKFFNHVGAKPGDTVIFDFVGPYRMTMELKRRVRRSPYAPSEVRTKQS